MMGQEEQRQATLRQHGFTLIELIVVIVIIGILAPVGGMLISQPVQSYVDMARRTELVDQAEMTLRRMQRDIRAAVPNSVRISGDGNRLELYHAIDGGRYRLQLASDGSGDPLDFLAADNSFDAPGGLNNFAEITLDSDGVVIYNLTATGASGNVYAGDNRATIATGSTANNVRLTAPTLFPLQSSFQRFFITDTPISYVISDGRLTRFSGYTPAANTVTTGLAGGSLVAENIVLASSSFSYAPGTAQRAGLVTLQLTLSSEGEQITLLHQVHVDNSP